MSGTTTLMRQFPRELAHRENDGIAVSLLWCKADGRVSVVVRDTRCEDGFELNVDAAAALDAFEHPYAYAALRGVEYRLPGRAAESAEAL